jgi:hypothetical protein
MHLPAPCGSPYPNCSKTSDGHPLRLTVRYLLLIVFMTAIAMLREDIDACWPLVLEHRDRVLTVVRRVAEKYRVVSRIDRAALVGLYMPGRDFNEIARRFGVSPGSINNALSRLVRIARELDRTETLERAATGKRFVVIVPVDHQAEGEYVRSVLARHELDGVVEQLVDD